MSFRVWFGRWLRSIGKMFRIVSLPQKTEKEREKERRRRIREKFHSRGYLKKKRKVKKTKTNRNTRLFGAAIEFAALSLLGILLLPAGFLCWGGMRAASGVRSRISSRRSKKRAKLSSFAKCTAEKEKYHSSTVGKDGKGKNHLSGGDKTNEAKKLPASAGGTDLNSGKTGGKAGGESGDDDKHLLPGKTSVSFAVNKNAKAHEKDEKQLKSNDKDRTVLYGSFLKNSTTSYNDEEISAFDPKIFDIRSTWGSSFANAKEEAFEFCPKSRPASEKDRFLKRRMYVSKSELCQNSERELEIGARLDFFMREQHASGMDNVEIELCGERIGYVRESDRVPLVAALMLGRKIYGVVTDAVVSGSDTVYEYEVWFCENK